MTHIQSGLFMTAVVGTLAVYCGCLAFVVHWTAP